MQTKAEKNMDSPEKKNHTTDIRNSATPGNIVQNEDHASAILRSNVFRFEPLIVIVYIHLSKLQKNYTQQLYCKCKFKC